MADTRRPAQVQERVPAPALGQSATRAHVISGVRGTYDRHAFEAEKAEAFNALAVLVARILEPSSKIVQLRADFPVFMHRLAGAAPNVRMWLRPFNDLNLVEELDRGTLHVVIGVFGRAPARFVREPLITGPNAWVMRASHPAVGRPFTLETLAQFPHIDILLSGRAMETPGRMLDQEGLERSYVTSNPLHLEGVLAEHGLTRRVGATVSHILAVPPLLAATDMIAFLPRQFAVQATGTHGLVAFDPPYEAPPLQIAMLSHRTMGAHPSVAWLRAMLLETAQSMQSSADR